MLNNTPLRSLCEPYLGELPTVHLTPEEIEALPSSVSSYRKIWKPDHKTEWFEPTIFSAWRRDITLHRAAPDKRFELIDGLGRVQEAIRTENTEPLTFRMVGDAGRTTLLRVAALLHCGDKSISHSGLKLADAFNNDQMIRLDLLARMAGFNKDHMRKLVKVVKTKRLYQYVMKGQLTEQHAINLITRKHKDTLAKFLEGQIDAEQVRRLAR